MVHLEMQQSMSLSSLSELDKLIVNWSRFLLRDSLVLVKRMPRMMLCNDRRVCECEKCVVHKYVDCVTNTRRPITVIIYDAEEHPVFK